MALAVELYNGTGGFDALAGAWNDLLRRSRADTPFLSLEFQRTWWACLGEGELLILAVRDGDELIGIVPLFEARNEQGQRILALVGGVEVADYLDVIAAEGREADVLGALVDYLAAPQARAWPQAPAWDALDLCNIHQDSATLAILPRLAEARGWSASVAREDVCPTVQLPGTWEDYLQLLDKKQRHELRRKTRRVEAQEGVSWYIVGPGHNLEAEVEGFLALMAASSPEKADFLTARMRGFFHQLARVVYDAGWLQLACLTIGTRKAAAYLNFVYNDRVLVYNSGFDPGAFPKLSAGAVLIGYCIRHAIEQGCGVFDFLQGNERYKYQLGGQDVEVRRLLVYS